jgi:hypothetical protein
MMAVSNRFFELVPREASAWKRVVVWVEVDIWILV